MQRDTLAATNEGHPAKYSVTRQLQQSLWWPDMTGDIKEYAASCLACSSADSRNYQTLMEEGKARLGPCVNYSADFEEPVAGKHYLHVLIEN